MKWFAIFFFTDSAAVATSARDCYLDAAEILFGPVNDAEGYADLMMMQDLCGPNTPVSESS